MIHPQEHETHSEQQLILESINPRGRILPNLLVIRFYQWFLAPYCSCAAFWVRSSRPWRSSASSRTSRSPRCSFKQLQFSKENPITCDSRLQRSTWFRWLLLSIFVLERDGDARDPRRPDNDEVLRQERERSRRRGHMRDFDATLCEMSRPSAG